MTDTDSLDAAQKVSLLMVDDELEFLETMHKHLSRKGLQITTADGCSTAIKAMEADPRGVIVMDVSMPGIDGIQCLQKIKKHWPKSEVIMLTGHASIQSGVQGMQSGAFDYCLKPIDTQELVEKIELAARKFLANQKR
ncbi:response regulator [Desulfogranum japonicum]|uniref:response regulator n=1 Tax=Desulfogranum japonicum TaxID=231447 RepID=UPI000408A81C|nr:response regulator [Desulfogranum japonicum]